VVARYGAYAEGAGFILIFFAGNKKSNREREEQEFFHKMDLI
jgi:hypothetical protein